MNKAVQEAVTCIRGKRDASPAVGIITGSGWDLTEILDGIEEIPYHDIPGFPWSTVEGHKGRVLLGSYKGKEVLYLQGRVHYYEGYTLEEVSFPIEVLSGPGVKNIIMTNAAGGIRPYLKPGDFMVITDHINLMGINPLRGLARREGHAKFVDMSQAYDKGLVNKVLELGASMGITIHCGVLAAMSGPSYETPAEIQMLRILGADAVCMSTVPEVITCRHLGMRVLGLSMITNYAAGLTPSPLRHPDVVKAVELRRKDACRLVSAVIENMPR
ncbi:MAG: purine-nucleoside phosphorylase [Nitrospirae bacterium]|nr:purine-nucleoside phosphorylase [Nitrospirota bacterium]